MRFIQVRFIQIVTTHGQNGKEFCYEKIFSIFITCCLLAALCKTAYAFETENSALAVKNGRLVAQSAIQKLVDDYFSVRKDTILQTDKDSLAHIVTLFFTESDTLLPQAAGQNL